jgi:glycosyltransferase involved in cell wall biosynthesis
VRSAVTKVLVVVPARNEERNLHACLRALDHAVRRIHAHAVPQTATSSWPVPSVEIVVVLDSCTDGSARVVAQSPGVQVVSTSVGRVGAARAIGVRRGLDLHDGDGLWIANTDADSRVPPEWLTAQLDAAHAGADLFCGLVQPDLIDCGPSTFAAWRSAYRPVEGHRHIHGANLGIRASAYIASGGFDPRAAVHEDVELVQAARRRGYSVVAAAAAIVATSGRTDGRVGPGGFAGYLSARSPQATAPAYGRQT